MKRKILLTGGAGFIGLHLTNRLLDEGFEVDIVDNFSRAVDDPDLKNTLGRDSVRLYNLDLLNTKNVKKFGSDYYVIIHLAAIVGVKQVTKQPMRVLQDNVNLLGNVIQLAQSQDKLFRLLFSSTSEVYAGTLKHFDLPLPTPEETPLTITDLKHPRSSYMLSKIFGEALCFQSGLPVTIFRPHNIYGPRMGLSHVIPELLKRSWQSKNGRKLDVYSVKHRRSFCYIEDAVEMLVKMILLESCSGKVLNLGKQGPEVSIKEVAEIVMKVQGKELLINSLNEDSGSPSRRAPDMKLTKTLISYEAKVELEEGIRHTFEWYEKNVFQNKIVFAI